jgi:2Fe-2S ferredoxin
MGGKNPYLKNIESPKLPAKRYSVLFVAQDGTQKTIDVDPEKLPLGDTGLPGSLLDIALNNGIEIDHACGGVLACSTCHIWVQKGLNSCGEASDEELDQIEKAPKNNSQSRLACQCIPDGSAEKVEVKIPKWNRNQVSEHK